MSHTCKYDETGTCFECGAKQPRRDKARAKAGKERWTIEPFKDDKERMKRWLAENGYSQAEGLKILLDAVKAI